MASLRLSTSRHCAQGLGSSAPSRPRRGLAIVASADLNRPSLQKPVRPEEPPKKLFDEKAPSASSPASMDPGVVTVQFQRQKAKEMLAYFNGLKQEQLVKKAQVFGWTEKNEISNGRWVMFGLLVGVLTEYATGVDFPDQLKLIITNLGIADLE